MIRPISILTFRDPNGVILYRGYIPQADISSITNNSESNDDYSNFLNDIYREIEYNPNTPLNNQTKYGAFLEHHTRFLKDIHLENMDDIRAHFFLYQNPRTSYLCIHHNSPIFLEQDKAIRYSQLQTELAYENCYITIL